MRVAQDKSIAHAIKSPSQSKKSRQRRQLPQPAHVLTIPLSDKSSTHDLSETTPPAPTPLVEYQTPILEQPFRPGVSVKEEPPESSYHGPETSMCKQSAGSVDPLYLLVNLSQRHPIRRQCLRYLNTMPYRRSIRPNNHSSCTTYTRGATSCLLRTQVSLCSTTRSSPTPLSPCHCNTTKIIAEHRLKSPEHTPLFRARVSLL